MDGRGTTESFFLPLSSFFHARAASLGIDNAPPTAQYLRMRYRVAPVALAATLAIAAVCGDSDRDAPFTFTPVPYTVVATSATPPGEMLVVDEGNGSLYVADEVLATVNAREEKVFSAWATGVGFEEIDVIELVQGQVIVHLRVPPGSVDEAIAFIEAARSDVIEANRNVLATLDRP